MLIDGIPACPRCGVRPRKPIPARAAKLREEGRRWYGYCAVCRADEERDRRLREHERQAQLLAIIAELRAVTPTGRHHAG